MSRLSIVAALSGLTALSILALLGSSAAARQRPTPPAQDPAFSAVEEAYLLARKDYDQARVDAARGRGPAPTQHPAVKYWPRMESVAAQGSARARQWLCENVGDGVPESERRAVIERELAALLACCAADDALFGPITGVKTQATLLGDELSLELLERIAEGSTNSEVQARAMFEQTYVISDRGRTTDPDRIAKSLELQRAVVLAFPGTRASKDAAEGLLYALQQRFQGAMQSWTVAALVAQAAGKSAESWGEAPFHTVRAEFETLAATGHPGAKSWMEALYPSLVQAEKLAPDLALDSWVRDLGRHYALRDGSWARARMLMLELAVRYSSGNGPWLRRAVSTTADEVSDLAALSPLPFTSAVLELAQGSELRAQALWIEAQTRILERSEDELRRALEALDAIGARHKDMIGLVEKSAKQSAALRAVMPGAVLPDSRSATWAMKDSEDLELALSGYRGRVVLVDVFDVYDQTFPGLVGERIALHDRLAGRPFELVGLCASRCTLPGARKAFAELGITWRCGLPQGMTHPYMAALFASSKPPTTILVDAQGVIRARGRPFAELARLAEELTVEAERASATAPDPVPK